MIYNPMYMTRMEACATLDELRSIGLAMLMDETLQQPRHKLATLQSIYRDNVDRILANSQTKIVGFEQCTQCKEQAKVIFINERCVYCGYNK